MQGSYAIALGMGLIPDELRKATAARLAELIHDNGDLLDTGFLATPYLLDALFENGQAELAWTLLVQDRAPSWLYQVDNGATTIWESWNSVDTKGRVKKISRNHYSFGVVADWIHRRVSGLAVHDPGYRHVTIAPAPDRRIISATRTYRSPQGLISVSWQREDGVFRLHTEIPAGTEATLVLPDGTSHIVGPGSYDDTCADPCPPAPTIVARTHSATSVTVDDSFNEPRQLPHLVGGG